MVPLVKMEDSGYRSLDPASIRLPPPQPSTERLLKIVDLFYSGPSHDTPRDTEGWERLGLYEWSRDKQAAIRRKQEDIQVTHIYKLMLPLIVSFSLLPSYWQWFCSISLTFSLRLE